ncbi:MAG TPA: hypothetical protein DEA08_35230 [Planctomycetes bacterium]|nr:hypothetical protein [Planctomycetota bacterium]
MRAAQPFVCVRVTDLRGVDLDAFSFDFDLTFAVLVVHPDGRVLHRYGGRDHRSADARLSMGSLVTFLEAAAKSAAAHVARPRPAAKRRTLDDVPVWRAKMERRKQPLACYHCHYVFDAERHQRLADGTWTPDQVWRWPPPERIGLTLAREPLGQVAAVRSDSPAARAGLRAGDRLLRAAERPLLSALDLSAVLEELPRGAARLSLRVERAGREVEATLALAAGWKVGTPLEFSWRPSKWDLSPRPGFGGRDLGPAERSRLGLPAQGLAFRVGYIVDWGGVPDPRFGQRARQAGLRKGDLVLGVEGVALRHHAHFHSWWRLTRQPGDEVVLRVRRGKDERRVRLRVPPRR